MIGGISIEDGLKCLMCLHLEHRPDPCPDCQHDRMSQDQAASSAPGSEAVQRAKATVEALGYVVLKESSYRRAQERQRVADALREHAEQDAEHARQWARDCLTDERRLRDRLTFVYGVAKARGATDDELRGPVSP